MNDREVARDSPRDVPEVRAGIPGRGLVSSMMVSGREIRKHEVGSSLRRWPFPSCVYHVRDRRRPRHQ
jgi:hypothetical protein